MAPWSFISSLSFPTLGSFNSYLPTFALPEDVQHKLVAFILRRTLGRFVKRDGLLGTGVEDGISKGSMRFRRLDLDPGAFADLVPSSLPLEFVSGRIDDTLIGFPFPNLLSGSLSVQIDSLDIHLRVKRQCHQETELQTGSIAQSVLNISNDFLSTTLSSKEVQELSASIHNGMADMGADQGTRMAASAFDEREYHTPGGFPGQRLETQEPAGAGSELPPTTVLASIIENLLSRLQVEVVNIKLRITLPHSMTDAAGNKSDGEMANAEDTTLEVHLEGARYSSEAGETKRLERVLRISSAALWIVRSGPAYMDESSETSSSRSSRGSGRSTPTPRDGHLSPSRFVAPHSLPDMDDSKSIYESAIGFDGTTEAIDPFEASSSHSSESQSERGDRKDVPLLGDVSAARLVKISAVEQSGIVVKLKPESGKSREGEGDLQQTGRLASIELGHISSTLRENDMERVRDFAAVFQRPVTPNWDPELADRSAIPSTMALSFKVTSLSVTVSPTEEDDLEVLDDRIGGDIADHSGRGLVLKMNLMEASISGNSSSLTIHEAGLSWRACMDSRKQVESFDLLQSFDSIPPLYKQSSGTGNRSDDPSATLGQGERFRLPGLSTETSPVYERRPFLAVAARGDYIDMTLSPVHFRVHMDVVESMLPFVKQLSARVNPNNKEPDPGLEKPAVMRRIQMTCAMIRLEVRFPLQDRYYDSPLHIEGHERHVVLDMTNIKLASTVGTPTKLTFAGTHVFFGLLSNIEQTRLPAILSVGDRVFAGEIGSPGECRIRFAHSALPDETTSIQLQKVEIWLDRENVAGLQYMADDLTRWLDAVLHGDNMSARDNIKLVSSRFFGPTASSSPMDLSIAEMGKSRRPLARLSLESVSLNVLAEQSSISIQGTGTSVNLDAVEGKQVGTVIALSLQTAMIKAAGPDHPELVILHCRDGESSTRACLALTVATIQDTATSIKQTTIDLVLHSVAIHTRGRALWMHHIGEILKPPVGVFTEVTPSDVTKLVINLEQTAAVFHQSEHGGSLCFDVQQFRLRTTKRHHAIEQEFVFKSDEIRLLASDTRNEPLIDSDKGNSWQAGAYSQVAQMQNLRATTTSLANFEQIKIEIARLDLAISVCADSLRSTLHLLQRLASSFSANDIKAPVERPAAQLSSPLHLEKNSLAHDLREKTYTPDTIKPSEGDLLDDDLPIDRQFLTISRKGKTEPARTMLQDGSDGITIHCDEWFDLQSDVYTTSESDLAAQTHKAYKRSIAVIAKGCNLKIDLHDGYDWELTRVHIESKRKEMREKLRSLRELLASGQQSFEDIAAFSDFAFNSVHVGLPEHANYSSPEELAQAIDAELADEKESQEAAEDAWQTLEPRVKTHPSDKQARASASLRRHGRPGMELRFIGVDIDYSVPLVPRAADLDASVEFSVATIEIIDHLPTSTWKTFLKTRPAERVTKGLRQSDPGLSRCQIKWYPNPQALGSEAIMKLDILPVRMHVDQDAIDFCKRFASFSNIIEPVRDARPEDSSRPGQFVQRAEVSPIEIRLDYKPKRIDMNSLRQGHLGELINLFHFEDSKVILRKATVRGVSGWGSVYSALMEIWSPDIRATQMSDLVGGAAPVRSLIKVGGGVADLILLPIEQYQKDGRLVKGLQRGGKSFAKTTTLEAIKLSSKLATGTQVILERAEAALRSGSALPMEVVDSEGSLAHQRQSRYAEQPTGARQGFSQAYSALSHDLGSAVQTILAIPMEVHENASGSNASGRTVIRAVPLAVVQTMKGVTNASRKTLQGIRNQLDSQLQQELQEKYK